MAAAGVKIARAELWPVDRLRPNPRNPRNHSEDQVRAIAGSIRQFGFTAPIIVDDDGMIVAGHGRWLAARTLAMVEVPVIVARGWSDAQKEAYLIADNALTDQSQWDESLLASAVAGLEEDGFDVKLLGLSAADMKRLRADDDDDLQVHEVATTVVRDEFWISIRGPLQYQAETLKRMRDATAEMGGVTVQLGTIGKD